MAEKLDRETAEGTVDLATQLAAKTTFGSALGAIAKIIAALADQLDPALAQEAAERVINQALEVAVNLEVAFNTGEYLQLIGTVQTIDAIADKNKIPNIWIAASASSSTLADR